MLNLRGLLLILGLITTTLAHGQQQTIEAYINQTQTPYELFVAADAKDELITLPASTDLLSYLEQLGYQLVPINEYQRLIVSSDVILESVAVSNRKAEAAKAQGYITLGKVSGQQQCLLNGTISDDSNQELIIGATLLNEVGGNGAITDINGNYSLTCACNQPLKIRVESIGYEQKILLVNLLSDATFDIKILPSAEMIEEVVISTQAADDNVKSSMTGLSQLSIQEIKKMPSLLGEPDVIKSLLTLSGVTNAGEGSGGVNVRGGNADQNLILLDEMTFFNPTHSFGFFSALHSEMLSGLDLYKGLMPSNYGGRLSSVLQTHSTTGDFQKWKTKIGLGLIATKAFVEGPIIKDKTALAVATRLSHINWLLKGISDNDINQSRTNFYDLHGKLTHRFSQKLNVELQGYQSNDGFKFSEQFDLDYKSSNASLAINYLSSDRLSFNLRGTYGVYESALTDLQSTAPAILNTDLSKSAVRGEAVADLGKEWTAKVGVEYNSHIINPGVLNNEAEQIISQSQKQFTTELSPYTTLSGKLLDRISITAGVRVPIYNRLGNYEEVQYQGHPFYDEQEGSLSYTDSESAYSFNQLEPRVGLTIDLISSLSMKLSYNKTSQFISQLSNTAAPTPIDFWMVSNRYIQPMTADAYSLGLYKNWNDNAFESSVEAYFKDINNVTETIDFADIIANPTVETQLLQGIGQTYGIEANLSKSTGQLTGKLNYTYSRSLRQIRNEDGALQINNGDWYPANFDKPHILNLNAKYEIGKRASVSAAFTYSTGRPVTAPISVYENFDVIGIYVFSERNAFRIPDYHRLDLVFDYYPNIKKDRRYKTFWSFGVYNIYGRNNAYSVFFEQANGAPPRANSLAIIGVPLPSITLNIEFQ